MVDIYSGNGLLPDGTKPLPEPMLTNHQLSLVISTWGHFQRKFSWYYPWYEFEKDKSKMTATSSKGQWVNIALILGVSELI